MTIAEHITSSNAIERGLLRLESRPWYALYRVFIGLLILPMHGALWADGSPAWSLPVLVIGVLGMLRVIPAVVRKVLPFSASTRTIWSERRLMGKRYDSYQWQKVFWIGLGLAISIALTESYSAAAVSIAAVGLLGGIGGMLRWRVASSQPGHPYSRAGQAV